MDPLSPFSIVLIILLFASALLVPIFTANRAIQNEMRRTEILAQFRRSGGDSEEEIRLLKESLRKQTAEAGKFHRQATWACLFAAGGYLTLALINAITGDRTSAVVLCLGLTALMAYASDVWKKRGRKAGDEFEKAIG